MRIEIACCPKIPHNYWDRIADHRPVAVYASKKKLGFPSNFDGSALLEQHRGPSCPGAPVSTDLVTDSQTIVVKEDRKRDDSEVDVDVSAVSVNFTCLLLVSRAPTTQFAAGRR